MQTQQEQTDHAAREGRPSERVESYVAQIPALTFPALAVGSVVLALSLRAMNRKLAANFVGLWAPTLMLIGLYNKLVQVESLDRKMDEDSEAMELH